MGPYPRRAFVFAAIEGNEAHLGIDSASSASFIQGQASSEISTCSFLYEYWIPSNFTRRLSCIISYDSGLEPSRMQLRLSLVACSMR
jgi:hypothetical protein